MDPLALTIRSFSVSISPLFNYCVRAIFDTAYTANPLGVSGVVVVPLLRTTPLTGVGSRNHLLIRPPGSLEGKAFLARCVKCGECLKVCLTNGLQPALLEAGIEAIWFEDVMVTDRDGRKISLQQPHVDLELCIGCGICETKCPVLGTPAITVTSIGESRSPENQLLLK